MSSGNNIHIHSANTINNLNNTHNKSATKLYNAKKIHLHAKGAMKRGKHYGRGFWDSIMNTGAQNGMPGWGGAIHKAVGHHIRHHLHGNGITCGHGFWDSFMDGVGTGTAAIGHAALSGLLFGGSISGQGNFGWGRSEGSPYSVGNPDAGEHVADYIKQGVEMAIAA